MGNEKLSISERRYPTFIQPKHYRTVILLSDFRKMNQIICRKLFTIKNKMCNAEGRRIYACIIVRPKHGVLSHRFVPWIQTPLYFFTPVEKVQ